MDAWNPDQLKRMQKGGNAKLNSFLLEYGIQKGMDIKEKYNSKAAEFYREKLRAEVDGHSYTPPPPSDVLQLSAMSRSKSYGGGLKSKSTWDEWDSPRNSDGAFGNEEQLMPLSKSNGNGSGHLSGHKGLQALQASAASKEDFFSRKIAENAAKPEGLPPSQGGKYVGFGSTPSVPPRNQTKGGGDDVSEMFSRGMSGLGVWAGQAANAARDQASNFSAALKDSGMTDKIGQSAQLAAERTREYGNKGWSLLRSAYASAASRIEQSAAQQGYKIDLGSRKFSGSSYSRVEGSAAPEGFNAVSFEENGLDDNSLIHHHNDDHNRGFGTDVGYGGDDWGRENEWQQETYRAPAAKDVTDRKYQKQQQDEWGGWEDAPPHDGLGDAANEDANDWGKW